MSTKLCLDGRLIRSEDDFHGVIDRAARSVGFVEYGRNLDALWDTIRGILPFPIEVRWDHANASREALGDRFEQIVSLFREAEEKLGSSLLVTIEP